MPKIDKETFEKELQRKYLQLQLYKHQLNNLVEQRNTIESRVEELKMSIHALEGLEKIKKGDEMWSSLGSNAFVMSDIKDTDNVLINIGAGVVIKNTRERSVEILQSRLNEMEEINTALMAEIIKYSEEVGKLEPEVQRLAQQL
jgi:prefoldin alpha subunit